MSTRRTMLEVARNHGHSVEICDRQYAGIFEQVDPTKRTDEDTAIRAARRKISGAHDPLRRELGHASAADHDLDRRVLALL